jgi:hypothetical protein
MTLEVPESGEFECASGIDVVICTKRVHRVIAAILRQVEAARR